MFSFLHMEIISPVGLQILEVQPQTQCEVKNTFHSLGHRKYSLSKPSQVLEILFSYCIDY